MLRHCCAKIGNLAPDEVSQTKRKSEMTVKKLDVLIRIIVETLSDGSKVYDIELPGGSRLHAVSVKAAIKMAESFVTAINDHTVGQTADYQFREVIDSRTYEGWEPDMAIEFENK